MEVGFTGSRKGLAFEQRRVLRKELQKVTVFRHGDCVGADFEAWEEARAQGIWTIAHPPNVGKLRAYTENDESWPPRPYLEWNHDIVNASEVLIACPGKKGEVLRSGTWAAIRHAQKTKKPVTIIYPDGTVKRSG